MVIIRGCRSTGGYEAARLWGGGRAVIADNGVSGAGSWECGSPSMRGPRQNGLPRVRVDAGCPYMGCRGTGLGKQRVRPRTGCLYSAQFDTDPLSDPL